MSRLPLEDRNVWGQPGPEYEPQHVCAHPFCAPQGGTVYDYRQLELHHLWPRSFLRNQPTNWVQLPDGRVVGNLVYLCREHHRQITENEMRIVWEDRRFMWVDGDYPHNFVATALNPQPPLSVNDVRHDPGHRETPRRPLEGLTERLAGLIDADPFHQLDSRPPEPGENCPTCHRRVNYPKKESSPQTTRVKSWRVPTDEFDSRTETLQDVATHLGISTTEKFWLDKTILNMCVLILQMPGGLDGD